MKLSIILIVAGVVGDGTYLDAGRDPVPILSRGA